MYLIFLGAPGSGKGTQAKLLSKKLGLPQISTGDLFRKEIKNKSELGIKISEIMEGGNLVDDETTIDIFRQRLNQNDCRKGAILDGIPRTIKQAEMLDSLFKELDADSPEVLYIELPEEEIITRISGRWTCRAKGHIYHEVYNPPKNPGICDIDGSELYQREDQKPEAIKKRISVYKKSTEPLINHYKNKDVLTIINGNQSIDEVHHEILENLNL